MIVNEVLNEVLTEEPAGLLKQATRLGQRLASFFDPAWPTEGEEDSGEPPRCGWQTRLVCLDLQAGGPQLEVGPLEGLLTSGGLSLQHFTLRMN